MDRDRVRERLGDERDSGECIVWRGEKRRGLRERIGEWRIENR